QMLRWHQTKPQLAGVQRNRYILGKELDDLHVGAIVVARDLMVLRTDKIERYDPWLGANERGRGRGLDKDFLDRIVAGDLRDEAVAHAAARLHALAAAIERSIDRLDQVNDAPARLPDSAIEPVALERVQHRGEIGLTFDRLGQGLAIACR